MVARIGYRPLLAALLLGLAAALLLALLPRRPARLVVRAGAIGPLIAEGETTQIRSFYGFNQAETAGDTSFRWTDGTGNFVVRAGERIGAPLVLRLRLCGCRAGPDAVSRLLLRVNGVPLADAASSARRAEWRRYAMLVQPETTAYSPDLLVELISNTVKNPQFGFPMGVALDTVELAPALPQRAYSPLSALALGLAIGALAVGGTKNREPRTVQWAAGASYPVSQFSILHSQFLSWPALGAAAVGLGLVAAQGLLYRPHPLAPEVLALGLLLALAPALLARATPAIAAIQALLLGLLVVAPQALGAWMLDDAYISFRYARNALAGAGFVFNTGERVEGYTNFLWTALFVPILGAGLYPAAASQALTLLLALATAALAWLGARRLAGPSAATAALALLATSAPFVLYAARGSGMETALFTLLVLGGVLAYLSGEPRTENREPESWNSEQGLPVSGGALWAKGTKNKEQRTKNKELHEIQRPSHRLSPIAYLASRVSRLTLAGALLALAAMTRPEGVLVAGVCGLHLLTTSWCGRRIAWRGLLGLSAGFLAIFGPYYLWRLSYYGYPLPNTFYAKVGGTSAQALRGLGYTAEFAGSQAPLIAIALLSLWPQRRTENHPEGTRLRTGSRIAHDRFLNSQFFILNSFLWPLVVIYTLYIVAVGGDHFPLYRFFVPLLPPLALLAALGFERLQRALPERAAAPALTLLAVGAIGWQAPQLYTSRTLNAEGRVWSENSVVEKNREIGLWLRAHTGPDTLLATGIAGAMPYYTERPTLDTLGLNDLHIAHLDVPTIGQGVAGAEKTDNDYILHRRPAYIPYSSAGALLDHPLFLRLYERGIVHGPEGRWLRLYKREDIAPPEGWAPIEDQ